MGRDVGSGGDQLPPDVQEAMVAHAGCMRDRGLDVPDPTFRGSTVEMGGDLGQPGYKEADEACAELHLDAIMTTGDPEQERAYEEHVLAQARCFRDLGYDVPDPVQDGGAWSTDLTAIPDDEFDAAQATCDERVPFPEQR